MRIVLVDSVLTICLTLLSSQALPASGPDSVAPCYTVQIHSVPLGRREQVLAVYDSLKAKGHLVYCRDAHVNGQAYIRLRAGLFKNRDQAQMYGEALHEREALDYFIAKANLRVEPFDDAFNIVTTPNDIWLQSPTSVKSLYHFDTSAAAATCSPVEIGPRGQAIVFACNNRILKIDLRDGSRTLLKQGQREEDLFNTTLAWSPDGQHIAYLDAVGWEQPTRLWIMQSDGRHDRCLVADKTRQTRVKSFHWHPSSREIFYVSGPTHGTVSVGGSLCRMDLDGNHRVVVPAHEGLRTQVCSEFHVADTTIQYRLAHFDTDFQVQYYTTHTASVD